ncbi:isovaleryl-CoA dehydrogenase [Alcaligenaceae bacterium CGII-47]|nr:isovaleryl-CoA dehydrogenase [Alcaligenaceae bacterium CGII-47]
MPSNRSLVSAHELSNQVPDLVDYNLYTTDIALHEAVLREGAGAQASSLTQYGARLGAAHLMTLGADVNRYPPELRAFDRTGQRVDQVVFHPGWHQFMGMAFEQGMHCSAWSDPGPGAQVARAARYILHGQVEAGSLCPLTMTSAAIPILAREPWFNTLAPHLYSRQYDERDLPVAQKAAMMVGMGMTEKQGGSDLRSNITYAQPLDSAGQWHRLNGHKWFFSSPTSDAHLLLAREGAGHSCFYVPRWLDDGQRNTVQIQRLKDKLGNRSNASAEVEFSDVLGRRVGPQGRGIATLVEMASTTRLDCVLGSAAVLRQALVQALHHAYHRRAFGALLIQQPLMRQVLADLVLESEAATMLAMRLARSFDTPDDPAEQALRRMLTPAAKFWVCKRTVEATAECMEVWGGNGFIEEGPMPRLLREAPVNSIWEGSGNVMCLDVLRAVRRHPEQAIQLVEGLVQEHAQQPLLVQAAHTLIGQFRMTDEVQQLGARYTAQLLVLLVQADLMLRHTPDWLARIFIESRLGAPGGRVFGGQAIAALASDALFARAWPH